MSYDHTGGACSQQKNTGRHSEYTMYQEKKKTQGILLLRENFLRVLLLFKTKTCSFIKERRKESVNLLHLDGSFVMKLSEICRKVCTKSTLWSVGACKVDLSLLGLTDKTWTLLDSSTKAMLANKPFNGRVSNPGTKIMTCSANSVSPSKHS